MPRENPELALWEKSEIERALVDGAGDLEMSTSRLNLPCRQRFGTADLEHKKGPQGIRVPTGKSMLL